MECCNPVIELDQQSVYGTAKRLGDEFFHGLVIDGWVYMGIFRSSGRFRIFPESRCPNDGRTARGVIAHTHAIEVGGRQRGGQRSVAELSKKTRSRVGPWCVHGAA